MRALPDCQGRGYGRCGCEVPAPVAPVGNVWRAQKGVHRRSACGDQSSRAILVLGFVSVSGQRWPSGSLATDASKLGDQIEVGCRHEEGRNGNGLADEGDEVHSNARCTARLPTILHRYVEF